MRVVGVDAAERAWAAVVVADDAAGDSVQWLPGAQRLEAELPGLLATASAPALDALVVVTGPGSLTGIRVATSALLGVALARGVTLHGVGSLEVAAGLEPGAPVARRSAGRGAVWELAAAPGAQPERHRGDGPPPPLGRDGAPGPHAERWARALLTAVRAAVARPPLDVVAVDPAAGAGAGPGL